MGNENSKKIHSTIALKVLLCPRLQYPLYLVYTPLCSRRPIITFTGSCSTGARKKIARVALGCQIEALDKDWEQTRKISDWFINKIAPQRADRLQVVSTEMYSIFVASQPTADLDTRGPESLASTFRMKILGIINKNRNGRSWAWPQSISGLKVQSSVQVHVL